MAPTFSVVIPTYNRSAWLTGAVSSVLAQDFDDLECIVVDDGSDVALRLPDDARVRIVRHETNLGIPAALNTGIDAAGGEYVTFLDDDDEFTPDRLTMTLDSLGTADVVLCWAAPLDGPPRSEWNRHLEGNVYDTILDTWAPSKASAVMRRAAVPHFDPRYRALEDLEWWIRVSRTLTFTTVPRVGYQVRIHGGERNLNGPLARIEFGKTLMDEHREYFSEHARAAAFRWYVLGLLAMQLGDRRFARRAFLRCLRLRPTPTRLAHLGRALRPSTIRIDRPSPATG